MADTTTGNVSVVAVPLKERIVVAVPPAATAVVAAVTADVVAEILAGDDKPERTADVVAGKTADVVAKKFTLLDSIDGKTAVGVVPPNVTGVTVDPLTTGVVTTVEASVAVDRPTTVRTVKINLVIANICTFSLKYRPNIL